MIALYIAAGLLAGTATGGSDIETPAERTIRFNRAGGFFSSAQQIDPADVVDFLIDLRPMLHEGEQFASINLAVTATSSLLGFEILDSGQFAPVTLQNGLIRVWATVSPASRPSPIWAAARAGQFVVSAVTNSTPPRTWQRTAQIAVAPK